jgi:hypothetical protein
MAVTRTSVNIPPNVTLGGWTRASILNACSLLTESAPTTAADGMDLTGVGGYTVIAEALPTFVLSGAGSLLAYRWNSVSGVWDRAVSLDLAVNATGTPRGQSWEVKVVNPRDRIDYRPSGVTSTGTGLNVYILATDTSFRAE